MSVHEASGPDGNMAWKGKVPATGEARSLAGAGHPVELLGLMAHGMRDGLGSLMNGLEVIGCQEGSGRASLRRTLEFLNWECRRMSLELDRVMEVVRISRGVAVLSLEVVCLSELIDGVIAWARGQRADDGLEVAVEYPAAPVWVEADRARIISALGKLITRAHFWPREAGALRVRARVESRSVRIEFDLGAPSGTEGPGTEESGRRDDFDIAMARCLVERHGGEFEIGLGGIGLELPRLVDGSSGPVLDVVLVDTDRERNGMLGQLLSRSGYQVRLCETPDAAVRSIGARPAVAVVADLAALLDRAIRLEEWVGHLRAAGVSRLIGLGDVEDVARSAFRFDVLLAKPVEFEKLEQAVGSRRQMG